MKTSITCHFDLQSPLMPDGRLLVANDQSAWLAPEDFEVVAENLNEMSIEVSADIPDKSCRFLGHSDGQAPACYFESNGWQPWYMESVPSGFAPELVCLHCQLHAGCREERKHARYTRADRGGILEALPELSSDEAAEYTGHVDRDTGEIVG